MSEEPLSEDVGGKRMAAVEQEGVVEHVWKQGFPADTPHEQAIEVARQAALQEHPGDVLAEEIIQTPEHEAAGEFLVRIVIGRPDIEVEE